MLFCVVNNKVGLKKDWKWDMPSKISLGNLLALFTDSLVALWQ